LPLKSDGDYLFAARASTYYQTQNLYRIKIFDLISDVKEETNIDNSNLISPNPASDFINLPKSEELIKSTAIFSIFGEKVIQLNNFSGNIVDISVLSKGVYFLRINNKSYEFLKI
jgi:hypothetical protein